MDDEGRGDGQQHEAESQHVHRQAVLAEGMEEAGAHLQADGEDEQDEAEILDEGQHHGVDFQPEMAEEDAHEQNPGGADGYSLNLELAEKQTRCYDEGQDENRAGRIALCK